MKTLRASLFAATAISLLASSQGYAQDRPVPEDAGPSTTAPGDIIVTARRRAESITDVPISITALSQQALEAKGVAQMDDLQRATPSLQFRPTAGRRSNSTYEIRGIAANESLITQDPAVGIYVNDVYIARATGTNQSFYDIESVQVLYGPQGTLFGRNSPAGAVLVNTRKPVDRFEGEVSAGYGNYNRYEIGGMINIPVSETLAIRAAGLRVKRDGYGYDIINKRQIADDDVWSGRLSILFKPTADIENLTVGSYFRSRNNGSLNVLSGVLPCQPNTPLGGLNQFLTGTPPAACLYSPQVNAALGAGNIQAELAAQQARGIHKVAYDNPTYENARSYSITNTTTFNISDSLLIKNIAAYNDVKLITRTDLDGSPIKIIDTFLDSRVHQYSNELQLQGSFDRFDFVVGALYFYEKGRDIQISTQLSPFNPTNPQLLNTVGVNKSYAVFAQGSYKITDQLSLTAGGRYTWDKRRAVYDNPTSAFGSPSAACVFPASVTTTCFVELEKSYSDPTYTFSVDYKPTDDFLIYVAHRRGYRAGGFNARAANATQLVPFAPEKVTDFEIGAKGEIRFGAESALRGGIAVYRTKYDNIQRTIAFDPDGPGPLAQTTNIVNAAKATIKGFELNLGFTPVRGFDISGYWGHVNAKHDEFANDFTASRPIFDPSPASPIQCGATTVTTPGTTICKDVPFGVSKNTFGATVSLTPVDTPETGRVTFTTSWSYRSAFYGLNTLPILEEFSKAGSQQNVNLSLDWEDIAGSSFSAQAWVRNATNEKNVLAVLSLGRSLGLADYTYGDPRMYGMTLKYRFGSR